MDIPSSTYFSFLIKNVFKKLHNIDFCQIIYIKILHGLANNNYLTVSNIFIDIYFTTNSLKKNLGIIPTKYATIPITVEFNQSELLTLT